MRLTELDFEDFGWSLVYIAQLLFLIGCFWYFRAFQAQASCRPSDRLRR